MKQAGCIIPGILGVVALIIIIPLVVWGARVFFAEEIGRGNAEIQIESSNSRIPRYEEFFDLCVSVQNAETALDAEYARLERTDDTASQREIETNISALLVTRASGINQYNANASKNYTDARFLAVNLPYQLPTESYSEGMEGTTCAR
jgi:hypothetical protein